MPSLNIWESVSSFPNRQLHFCSFYFFSKVCRINSEVILPLGPVKFSDQKKVLINTYLLSLNKYRYLSIYLGFPGGSDGKESVFNEGDTGSIPELERSPGEGNSNPL